jgi:hypothetical protein
MDKAQFRGMKKITRVAGKRVRARQGQTARTVERISFQRVSRSCKVDPDLVRPACRDTHITQKGIGVSFEDNNLRQGGSAVVPGCMDRSEYGVRDRAYRH